MSPDPPHLRAPSLDTPGLAHGFFGRAGGVSRGLYTSLNCGPGSRDAPDAVAENRRRVAAVFGLCAERLLSLRQVHSARVVRVDGPWDSERPEADAIVTTAPGLALNALAADCAPVLFADAQAGVIAAAHAGWKGALAGVLEATVAEMVRAGAAPARIVAAIGPCIAQANYEVGPEFADMVDARFLAPGAGDRLQFDLKAFCESRLRAAGLTHIETLAIDTFADTEGYFSHRRSLKRGEGDYGRNISVIALR